MIRRVRGFPGGSAPNGNVGDAKYLFPIDRLFNANAKGVIRVRGVGVSRTLNGRITLYANGSIIPLDDLRTRMIRHRCLPRHPSGPSLPKDIVIADNALNTRRRWMRFNSRFRPYRGRYEGVTSMAS